VRLVRDRETDRFKGRSFRRVSLLTFLDHAFHLVGMVSLSLYEMHGDRRDAVWLVCLRLNGVACNQVAVYGLAIGRSWVNSHPLCSYVTTLCKPLMPVASVKSRMLRRLRR